MSETKVERIHTSGEALQVFQRMVSALNRHDLDEMVACFSRDYQSEQPFHPDRNFYGQGGVRKNWDYFFRNVPDIRMDIICDTVDGDTIWCETYMHGTRVDGSRHAVRGVTIQRVREGLIVWARLYIDAPAELMEGGLG